MKRGAIPVEECLKLAIQISEALEAAHEKSVIHRDLKPANIKITPDGKVKVLDFGLAKAFEGDLTQVGASNSPTLSMAATQQGVILGTAGYMSPEQARGENADQRADVWAFGVVLFEMLTGSGTFEGRTVSDVLAAVLAKDPQWNGLPHNLHPRLRLLLERCLKKESRDRYCGIGDARVDIQTVLADPSGALVPPTAEVVQGPQSKFPWIIAFVLGLVISGVAVWILKPELPTGQSGVARLAIKLPPGALLASDDLDFDISMDGTQIAYVTNDQLYLRNIDNSESVVLSGTTGARFPFFSPSGEWIGFFAGEQLRKVATVGGVPETLSEAGNAMGGNWAPDDNIYFTPSNTSAIWRVPASGGGLAEAVTELDREAGEISHRWPQVLPGGEAVLFTVWTGPGWSEKRVDLTILETGERRVVARGGNTGRYVSSGHVLYSIQGDQVFMAMPFDLEALRATGSAVPLDDAVAVGGEGALYAVSESGVLAHITANPARDRTRLGWVNRDGTLELIGPEGTYALPRLSPDGQFAAVRSPGPIDRVLIYDFSRDLFTPIPGEESNQFPVWHSNGEDILYRGTRSGFRNIYRTAADGSGGEEKLTISDNLQDPLTVSSDGWLLFLDVHPERGPDIWALQLEDENQEPQEFLVTPAAEHAAQFSPDDRSVLYSSNASGQFEVFVRPFPELEPRTLVGPGSRPRWSTDGTEVFYLTPSGQLMVAEVRGSGPNLVVGSSTVLVDNWPGEFLVTDTPNYDVSEDGRFLTVVRVEPPPPLDEINIVLNWFEELKERVPVP